MERSKKDNHLVSEDSEASSKRKSGVKNTAMVLAFGAALMVPNSAEAATPEIIPLEEIVDKDDLLTRSLHDGLGIVSLAEALLGPDVSKNDRDQVRRLALDIMELNGLPRDLDSVEARTIPAGTQIIIPVMKGTVYTIESGDNPSDLWRELGYQEAGYTKQEFAQANAIRDLNKITAGDMLNYAPGYGADRTTAANSPMPQPTSPQPNTDTPPVLPPNNPKPKDEYLAAPNKPDIDLDTPPLPPDLLSLPAEIGVLSEDAGLLMISQVEIENYNGSVLSQTEANEAFNLLVAATENYENPLAGYRVNKEELRPSPITDELRVNRQDYIDALASGQTNLAYLQNQVINRLAAKASPEVQAEIRSIIAGMFVEFIGEKNDWLMSNEEVEVIASMMLSEDSHVEYAAGNRTYFDALSMIRTDLGSLTIHQLYESIQKGIDSQVELVEMANEYIETLAPELRDLDPVELASIAMATIHLRQNGTAANDYLYDVLLAKLDGRDLSEGLNLLAAGMLNHRQSPDLDELFPDTLAAVLDQAISGFSQTEGTKQLSELIQQFELAIDSKLEEINLHSQTLVDVQTDLSDLNPELNALTPEQLLQVATTILSQTEISGQPVDPWFALLEAKAEASGNLELKDALWGVMQGVYHAEKLDLLLQNSTKEQDELNLRIDGLLDGGGRNLHDFLNEQMAELTDRSADAQNRVGKIITATEAIVGELGDVETQIPPLAVQLMISNDYHLVRDHLVAEFEASTGKTLPYTVFDMIDLELIKVFEGADEAAAQSVQAALTQIINDNIEAAGGTKLATNPGESNPIIGTLTRMVMNGNYDVTYADGTVMNIFSFEFIDKIIRNDGTPESVFSGKYYQIFGHNGGDLAPWFEYLNISGQAVLNDPYNDSLELKDGKIVLADNSRLWFADDLFPSLTYDNMNQASEWVYGEIEGYTYTVKDGDTLSEISQDFKNSETGKFATAQQIFDWNRGRIEDINILNIDQKIIIPPGFYPYTEIPETLTDINIDDSSDVVVKSTSPEKIPENAEILHVEIGSLGNLEIVQLTKTFKADKDMTPTAVINHWTGGDYEDENPLGHFLRGIESNQACPNGCSVHFFISEQGTIYQLSNLDSQLAHAKGANSFGVGIEIEGNWGFEGMPSDAVYQAALGLNAYLVQELGLELDNSIDTKNGILGHYEIDGSYLDPEDSGKTDPGKVFLEKLRQDIAQWVADNTPSVEIDEPSTENLSLAAEHERIKTKVENEVKSLKTYDNPYGITPSDVKPAEEILTVEEMFQRRLDKDQTGASWSETAGEQDSPKEIMQALIVYGGLLEINAPGFTPEELLKAATVTLLGEGGGYTHIVGDPKLEEGAVLNPIDDIPWEDVIDTMSAGTAQIYNNDELNGHFRDPELTGNSLAITANRVGVMIRQEVAAGHPPLDKWHWYRDWEEEHSESYEKYYEIAESTFEDISND